MDVVKTENAICVRLPEAVEKWLFKNWRLNSNIVFRRCRIDRIPLGYALLSLQLEIDLSYFLSLELVFLGILSVFSQNPVICPPPFAVFDQRILFSSQRHEFPVQHKIILVESIRLFLTKFYLNFSVRTVPPLY